ncbi:MAG TPA: SprB repeat-containing protein, partial [Chitinophagaceae bacterium]|nr:SprB repeat-containing protein [Chitinophagaceae bacterium]
TLIFISSPGQLSINTVNIVSAGCGINNGSIQVNAFGGINPLSFAINSNPFQAASLFSNLASGTYTIHIKDANNCAKDTVVTVPQISALSITSLTITAPGCAGNTGSISIAGSGGVTPYTYSNNGSLFVSTNTFGGLASGTYTVTLKDANGCTATSSTTLTSPANLFFGTTSVSLPTCLQQGSIITSGSGGTAPYQFALNSGSYTSSSVFNALNPGTYILHIKDANGCLHDTSIVLPVIALPQLTSLNTTQASCSFPNGGAITVNASGGTAPLSYSINGGTFSTASVFNTLGAGTYTLTVKDANGCTVSSVTTITAPNTVIFNYFTHTNVGCGGTPLANIASVLLGGNAPYQYSLNGGPFQASGIFMGLNAGTYTVTGKDASGCTKTTVTTITTSVTLNINSVGATNSPCVNPPTGSISISGSGSALPITYSLNGATSVASGTFSNLPPGTYTVSVYDGNGCHKDSVVTVNGNPALSFNNPIIVHPPCSGGIGSISLQGAGGNPPYTFSLNNSPFAPGSNWPSLVAGTYTIQLQDANGCLHDTVIFLIEPPEISMSSTFVSNASCTGAATGSISVVSVNGTPPYLYALNTGPWGTNPNFTGLGPGAYAVHVLDASGCGKDTFYVINSGGNFTINSITKTKPACNGGGNGSISFAVTGGVPPYQYALNGGAFGSGFTFTSLASGTYTLHAKDSSGCFKDSIIQLGQPAALHFTNVVLNAALCFGTATASVSYSATGGTSPYQYRIDGGSWGSTSNFTSITGGTHTLSILDSAGCTKDTVIQLAQPAALHFTNVSIISPGCLGNIGVISVQGSGGVAPYSFALGSGSYTSTGMFSSLPAGTYTIHLKDNNACIYDTLITLNNTAQIALNALNYSPAICPGSTTGFIQVSANSIYPPVLYTLNTNPPQSSGNFNTLSAGTYTVHIEDQIGCFTDSILTIQAAPPIQLINLVMIQPLCFNGINGSIQMNATGGMGSLRYAINGGSYGTSSLFQNLTSGSYTLHIKDSLFCSYDTIVFLGTPPPLSFSSINLVSPYCSNATDGKITITANGGTPPYLYAINTSLYTTNNQFVNLFQGNYTVHVKDYNGCIHDTIVYLPSATYMTFTNVVVHNVSCQSGNDGSISLGVNGGFSPYQFSINAVSTGSISVFNNLGTGNYTIVVTDLLGCQADTVLPVLEPAFPVKATILNIKDNLCRGDSIGSITAGASGGTPTYTFAINGGGFQTSPLFGGLPAGNFLITVKDQNGCTDDT